MERTLPSLEGQFKEVQWEVGLLRVREKETRAKSRLDYEGKHVEVFNLETKNIRFWGKTLTVTETPVKIFHYVMRQT